MEALIFSAATIAVLLAAVYTIRLDRDTEKQERQWQKFCDAFEEDRREP